MADQSLTPEQAQQLAHGFSLLQRGNAGPARALAAEVVSAKPASADAQHLLALCCKAEGAEREAEAAFRRALELAPEHPEVLGNYANYLARAGRVEEAIATHRRAVDAAPVSAAAWLRLGLAVLAANRPAEARRALERAVHLAPRSGPAWHALGRARRAAGDLAGAETALRQAVAVEPGSGTAWVNLGVVTKLLGRPADALACLDRAGDTGFAGPELPDARAGALVDLGRIEDAVATLRRLLGRVPHYAPAHVTLAHLLWEYGDPGAPDADPFALFRRAVRDQPRHSALQLAYIRALMEAGRASEALERIRALSATSRAPALAILEAAALDALGQLEAAGALYDRLHAGGGLGDAAFLSAYARHLLRSGRWDEAAARAEEATRANPDSQEAWGYLATAWRLTGDPREHWLCDYERSIALVDVEPPADYPDAPAFLAQLGAALDPLHRAQREPFNQSLRGGSQTPGRLFSRADPVIADARSAILPAVERHIASLPDDATHPFYRRKRRSVSFIGSWSVKLRSAGRHVNHFHPQGWMSSAYYITLPPSVTAGSVANDFAGWLQFGQPPEELGLDLAPRRYVQPTAGRVALFPSYLWHGTVPFEDTEPRVTVAFDMRPSD